VKQLRSSKHLPLISALVEKLEARERQVNALEFIEIARVLNVKPSALMAEIEGQLSPV
jgi:hypothetical protein